MANKESRILKNLLREVYLLLLALLAFVNFFIPAMIHTVSSRDQVRPSERLWVRVLPANDFQKALDLQREIGVYLADDDGLVDCFANQGRPGSLLVDWEGFGALLLREHKSQPLRIGAWLAVLPPDRVNGVAFADEVRAPLRLVVYPDRDSGEEIEAEIKSGKPGPGRLVLVLEPANAYQDERPLPDSLKPKAAVAKGGAR